jgi:hypothetical protein
MAYMIFKRAEANTGKLADFSLSETKIKTTHIKGWRSSSSGRVPA